MKKTMYFIATLCVALIFTIAIHAEGDLQLSIENDETDIVAITENVDANEDISAVSIYDPELVEAYVLVCERYEQYNVGSNVSIDTFVRTFNTSDYSTIDEYVNSYAEILNISDRSGMWQYNTGSKLPTSPKYSKYNLLSAVKKGDIIYEAEGGYGVTGHASIVEGVYYDTNYSKFYIQIIESIGSSSGSGYGCGVCRSVFDDDRCDERRASVWRVDSATEAQIYAAVEFCYNQIGKDYSLAPSHSTSPDTSSWYCSELVWAAYHNQGIVLVEEDWGYVYPDELKNSELTSEVFIREIPTGVIPGATFVSSSSVTLRWSHSSDDIGYEVYRSTNGSTFYRIATTENTSYTVTGLTSGNTYYFTVAKIQNIDGQNVLGNKYDPIVITTSFSAPTIHLKHQTSDTSVKIAWSKVYNATGYRVYRSDGGTSNYVLIRDTSSTTFTDTGLTSGTVYYYRVEAYNATSTTSRSTLVKVIPDDLLAPVIYYAKDEIFLDDFVGFQMKWTNSPGATKYEVYIAKENEGYARLDEYDETQMSTVGFLPNTLYYFKVIAIKSEDGVEKMSVYSQVKPHMMLSIE